MKGLHRKGDLASWNNRGWVFIRLETPLGIALSLLLLPGTLVDQTCISRHGMAVRICSGQNQTLALSPWGYECKIPTVAP